MGAPGTLNRTDGVKLLIGAGLAFSGPTLGSILLENSQVLATYASLHPSTWAAILAFTGVILNFVRKFAGGTSDGNESTDTTPVA